MNRNMILGVIALALTVIAGVLVYESTKKTPEEKMADSISQAAEDIGDAAQEAVNGQQ